MGKRKRDYKLQYKVEIGRAYRIWPNSLLFVQRELGDFKMILLNSYRATNQRTNVGGGTRDGLKTNCMEI